MGSFNHPTAFTWKVCYLLRTALRIQTQTKMSRVKVDLMRNSKLKALTRRIIKHKWKNTDRDKRRMKERFRPDFSTGDWRKPKTHPLFTGWRPQTEEQNYSHRRHIINQVNSETQSSKLLPCTPESRILTSVQTSHNNLTTRGCQIVSLHRPVIVDGRQVWEPSRLTGLLGYKN